MNTVMQFLETTFSPLVLLFTVSNLAAMGLQVKMPEVVVALRNKKSLALIFVWGWVVGPAFGYLITRVLPLAEPYVIVVLLASLAPCAPFLQQMVVESPRRHGLRGSPHPAGGGRHRGVDAIDGTPVDQGADDRRLGARETAPPDHTPAADDRSRDPALRRHCGNQDLPGGQGDRPALHVGDDRVVPCALRQGDARHGGQPGPSLDDPVHGRDGADHVSLRLRPETGTEKRHGAGDGHTEHRSGVGGGSCHSERGPAHRDDGRHVDVVVGCPRGHWSQRSSPSRPARSSGSAA